MIRALLVAAALVGLEASAGTDLICAGGVSSAEISSGAITASGWRNDGGSVAPSPLTLRVETGDAGVSATVLYIASPDGVIRGKIEASGGQVKLYGYNGSQTFGFSGGSGGQTDLLGDFTLSKALSFNGTTFTKFVLYTTATDTLDVSGPAKVVFTGHAYSSSFTDDSATTGNRTVNKVCGINAFAANATAITITNSFVTATSVLNCTLQTNDATATLKNCTPAAGSFTATITAAATGTTKLGWCVMTP